ncbi:MAG: class I SAM-dependent methyltransferase [Pseudomonadota bacterium]
MEKLDPKLNAVPETMLWTLYSRAAEARRSDAVLHDPMSIRIYDSLAYDFRGSFGRPNPFAALRALAFDDRLRRFLDEQGVKPVIVNLGEGLETQRYRVDAPDASWFTVDLPQAIAIRERFISPDRTHRHLPISVTNHDWIAQIPPHRPTFISAQGLFMYLKEREVRKIIETIANTLENWSLMFDSVPLWLSQLSVLSGGLPLTRSYRVPPMPWGTNALLIKAQLRRWLGKNIDIELLSYPSYPRGAAYVFSRVVAGVPGSYLWAPPLVCVSRH